MLPCVGWLHFLCYSVFGFKNVTVSNYIHTDLFQVKSENIYLIVASESKIERCLCPSGDGCIPEFVSE